MFGDPAPASPSFLQHMIQSMKSENGAFLFTDEFRTPLSSMDAVEGLLLALKHQPESLQVPITIQIISLQSLNPQLGRCKSSSRFAG